MTISMSSKQTLTICEHLWTRASIELTPSTHFLLFRLETAHLYNVLTHDHLTTVDRWWYSCVQVITAIVILGPLCTHGAARVHYTRQITWNTEKTLYIYVLFCVQFACVLITSTLWSSDGRPIESLGLWLLLQCSINLNQTCSTRSVWRVDVHDPKPMVPKLCSWFDILRYKVV